jgi:1,4-dihydroxy-2-naphthoate octaprenyltransferase
MLTCAVLVANNLRDIPTDEIAGKRTLAVRLGDTDTRRLYVALVTIPLLFSALAGLLSWPLLLALATAPIAVLLARRVLGGAVGRELIPVLARTGLLLLAWSALTAVGLWLGLVFGRPLI